MIRFFIVVVIAFAFTWYSSKSHSQTQTIPNIVTPNWNGAVIVPNLEQFGCCSGGPQPAYTTNDGTLHFSYGGYSAWQIYAINQALSGTGVQIKGYNYSWNVLNTGYASGNLQSWIWLSAPDGRLHEYYWYDLSADTQGTWKNYSGTQNFTQNYLLSDVGQLGIQFYGSDNRYWAGYYGPKVKDISVTLNYGVDQCTVNPLSSPSCPDYAKTYATNSLTTTTTTTNSTTSLTNQIIQNTIIPTTTAVTASNPAAPVQLVPTPAPVQSVAITSTTTNNTTSTTVKQETKTETKPVSTARAKEDMKKAEGAKSMEEQVATQGAVVAAIGFVPGFDAYQSAKLVDINALQLQRQYGKDVVDNRRLGRGLFGATDKLHQDMVNQQYQLGN